MKKLVAALFVLAFASSAALAGLDPTRSTVVPADALNGVVLCPDIPSPIAASNYTVTAKNAAGNPISGVSVVFEFPGPTNIRFCTSAVNTGTTNASGVSIITLRGGGCQHTSGSSYAVVVKGNGVVFRSYYNAKSPDFDGVGANGMVNLSDLLAFRGTVGCHDYDNSGTMTLSDTLIFGPAYSPAHSCALQP
jgi:hypothetical protein